MVPGSEDERADEHAAATDAEPGEDEERVETPFDHPLFLPAVLLGLSLWFLWDGFIVPMEEHLLFNRGGFVLFSLGTLWFGYKGLREMRELREERDAAEREPEG